MSESDRIADARRALGRRLAAHRQAAGYNQVQFAPLTGYGRSTVANVETGRQKVARDFWLRCDRALGTGGDFVAGFDEIEAMVRRERQAAEQQAQARREARIRNWQAAGRAAAVYADDPAPELPAPVWADALVTVRLDAIALWGHDLRPRGDDQASAPGTAALRWLVAADDEPFVREDGWRRIGERDVRRLHLVRAQLKTIDNAHGGGAAFPMAVAYLRREVAPLFDGRYSDATGRALLEATAEINLDVGWMAYDAGDHRLARRYLIQALRMAHAGGNRLVGGRVLAALSHQALHLRQVRLAVDLARAARAGTEHVATPKAAAMIAAMEACAHAAHHDERLCTAALIAAEDALSRARSADPEPAWLDFDEGGLWGHAARAHADLHHGEEARRYAQQSVILCRSDHSRTRAQRNAILARTHVALGEIDQAAAIGVRIVDDAWNLHSSHVHAEVAALARTIKTARPREADEFVSSADDLLTARPVQTATPAELQARPS